MLGVWTWLSLWMRDQYVPALDRGMQMAQRSRANGRYRDAHARMAAHSEAIIACGGVGAEVKRLAEQLELSLEAARVVLRTHLKEIFAKM